MGFTKLGSARSGNSRFDVYLYLNGEDATVRGNNFFAWVKNGHDETRDDTAPSAFGYSEIKVGENGGYLIPDRMSIDKPGLKNKLLRWVGVTLNNSTIYGMGIKIVNPYEEILRRSKEYTDISRESVKAAKEVRQ